MKNRQTYINTDRQTDRQTDRHVFDYDYMLNTAKNKDKRRKRK